MKVSLSVPQLVIVIQHHSTPQIKPLSSVIQITLISLNQKNKEHFLIINVCMSVCGTHEYIHTRLHVSIFVVRTWEKYVRIHVHAQLWHQESFSTLLSEAGVVVSVSNEGNRTYSHLGDGWQACLQGSSCPTVTGVHLGSLEDSESSNSLWQGFLVVLVLRHSNYFFFPEAIISENCWHSELGGTTRLMT